ncbi:MAG: hypothetical protein WBG42_10670 [Cryomorphaceae bacterium]
MEKLTGMAALIRDINNEREELAAGGTVEIEMLIYWHAALRAVRQAIESTIDYVQFGVGSPEGFAFDWYVASVQLNDFSADSAAVLSSDDALAMAFAIAQLKPLELSEFVYELQEWYEEFSRVFLDAQASSDFSARPESGWDHHMA